MAAIKSFYSHNVCVPRLNRTETDYLSPAANVWENAEFGTQESDVEGDNRILSYPNWAARGCSHRGHCVGAEERGVLCRNSNHYYAQQDAYNLVSTAQDWLAQESASALYGDVGKAGKKSRSKKPLRPKSSSNQQLKSDYLSTSPFIYHSAVESQMPSEFLQTQSFQPRKNIESSFKPENISDPFERLEVYNTQPIVQTLTSSDINKKPKKNKSSTKKNLSPKWKKAYFDTVRNHKKEKVGLILVGPDGPEFYAKVSKATGNLQIPVKKSNSLSALPTDRYLVERELYFSTVSNGAGGDSTLRTSQTGRPVEEASCSVEVEKPCSPDASKDSVETVIEHASINCEQDNKNIDSERCREDETSDKVANIKERTSMLFNTERIPLKCFLNDKNRRDAGDKTIYRAKKQINKFPKSPPKSPRVVSSKNAVDKVTNWLMSDYSSSETTSQVNNSVVTTKTPRTSGSHFERLKQTLPSIRGKSKEDHLQQLKIFLKEYVTYLEGKEDEDVVTVFDGSAGVKVEASKLIDFVNHPVKRISSEMTVNMTQSLTDALVTTDAEIAQQPCFLRFLKKIREDKFQKVISNVCELQELIRITDAAFTLAKPDL